MAHAIAFEEQRNLERRGRHGLEIIRPVEPGRAVEIGCANLPQRLEIIPRCIFGSVEHDMFEQMRIAGLAFRLVGGTDAIPDRDRHDGCLAICMDENFQAIVEREFLIGNVDRCHQFADRRWLGHFVILGQDRSGNRQGSSGQSQKQGARHAGHRYFPLDQIEHDIGLHMPENGPWPIIGFDERPTAIDERLFGFPPPEQVTGQDIPERIAAVDMGKMRRHEVARFLHKLVD